MSWRHAISLTLEHSAHPEILGVGCTSDQQSSLSLSFFMPSSHCPLPPLNQLPKMHRERTELKLGHICNLAEIQRIPRIVSIYINGNVLRSGLWHLPMSQRFLGLCLFILLKYNNHPENYTNHIWKVWRISSKIPIKKILKVFPPFFSQDLLSWILIASSHW